MSRLEAAQQQLEAAVSRLNSALEQHMTTMEGRQTDSERLVETLAAVEAERDQLKTVSDTVAGRLDETIKKLQYLLQD